MLKFLSNHPELRPPWSAGGAVVINPSFLRTEAGMAWTWRESTSWRGPFEAMWLAPDSAKPLRLKDVFADFGFSDTVADPKLWRLGSGLAVTFNSGWDAKQNRLYWAKLWPECGAPVSVCCPNRQAVEKNWGFFEFNGQLHALYSISPQPQFMRASHQLGDEFELIPTVHQSQNLELTSLGTQPIFHQGRWYFIGHRKRYIRSKRWYVGEMWSFGQEGVGFGDFRKEGGPWAHSLYGLLGFGSKRNPNLLSCTYFSGLEWMEESGWCAGYGLNDRSAHLKHLKLS